MPFSLTHPSISLTRLHNIACSLNKSEKYKANVASVVVWSAHRTNWWCMVVNERFFCIQFGVSELCRVLFREFFVTYLAFVFSHLNLFCFELNCFVICEHSATFVMFFNEWTVENSAKSSFEIFSIEQILFYVDGFYGFVFDVNKQKNVPHSNEKYQ